MHPFVTAAVLGAGPPHAIVIQGSLIAGLVGADPNETTGWSGPGDTFEIGTIDPDPLILAGFTALKIITSDFLNVFSFSILPLVVPGNVPNTDAVWKTLALTGNFRAGTNPRTITYIRAGMGFVEEIDEARWSILMGVNPPTVLGDDDIMVNGNTYGLVIDSGP